MVARPQGHPASSHRQAKGVYIGGLDFRGVSAARAAIREVVVATTAAPSHNINIAMIGGTAIGGRCCVMVPDEDIYIPGSIVVEGIVRVVWHECGEQRWCLEAREALNIYRGLLVAPTAQQ